MHFTEKDKERLKLSISSLQSLIDEEVERQRARSEDILRLRLELACLMHCKEKID